MNDQQREQVLRRLEAGETVSHIATSMALTREYVQRVLRERQAAHEVQAL